MPMAVLLTIGMGMVNVRRTHLEAVPSIFDGVHFKARWTPWKKEIHG